MYDKVLFWVKVMILNEKNNYFYADIVPALKQALGGKVS